MFIYQKQTENRLRRAVKETPKRQKSEETETVKLYHIYTSIRLHTTIHTVYIP
jgi:hypothetical protein